MDDLIELRLRGAAGLLLLKSSDLLALIGGDLTGLEQAGDQGMFAIVRDAPGPFPLDGSPNLSFPLLGLEFSVPGLKASGRGNITQLSMQPALLICATFAPIEDETESGSLVLYTRLPGFPQFETTGKKSDLKGFV